MTKPWKRTKARAELDECIETCLDCERHVATYKPCENCDTLHKAIAAVQTIKAERRRERESVKAQYNLEKLESVDCLTFGEMYDVLDVTTHRTKIGEVEKIKIKNDSGKESWYTADKFTLHAEAAAYLSSAAAGAGENAAQSATPDGSQVFIGIDMAAAADMTADRMAREIADAGKAVTEGLQAGLTIKSDAREALEQQIRERADSLMFGA